MGLFGTKKVKETSAQDCVGMIENFFRKVGANPNDQRLSDDDGLGWWIGRGSALIYLLLNERDNFCTLRIVSPIVHLPENHILPFYRKLLDMNMGLYNCALATNEDTVYVIHERPIAGLDQEEFEGTLNFLSAVADDLDNKLADEFGAKIYSEQMS